MTKLIYIQHPSVAVNKEVPPQDWDLSEKGLEETRKLLEQNFWKDDQVIYSSVEPKATSVAKLVHKRFGLRFEMYPELGEADRTNTPFLPLEEYMLAVQQAYASPHEHVHGWESHHEMFERNRKIIDQILAKDQGKTIAIIGHGGAGTCIKCYLCELPLSFDQDPQKTGCIFIVDVERKKLLQDWQPYC